MEYFFIVLSIINLDPELISDWNYKKIIIGTPIIAYELQKAFDIKEENQENLSTETTEGNIP